jgi:pimeloyl-ACP methyl ester carboxylesterase
MGASPDTLQSRAKPHHWEDPPAEMLIALHREGDQQGHVVAEMLLAHGKRMRMIVRNPSHNAIQTTASQTSGQRDNMQSVKKHGVTLAYEDSNPGLPPMLFVHGWGCDHTAFAPQAEFFSSSHRVVSVDLRGHGQSDAPHQDYTMATFADDLAWLCTGLAWIKPIVVGHSMGGNVALELAARHPGVPASIVLIDSVMFPHRSFLDALQPFVETLRGPDYVTACRRALLATCLPTDDETRKAQLIASLPKAPRHVLASALRHHLTEYDVTPAAAGCRVPIAYIGAGVPMADLMQFRSLTPQLVTAQTLGSGHFSPLFVPDQINAMLSTFLKVYSPGANGGRMSLEPS